MKTRTRVAAVVATIGILGSLAWPQASSTAIPTAKPEDVGLSSQRLTRIGEMMQGYIDAHEISGGVTVVARRGRVAHFEAHGLMDIASGRPMEKHAVFQIASMTKPVTGVAILMLIEEGKVRLRDPVSRFIPEFRDTQVAMPKSTASGEAGEIYTVPAEREVTVRDLLTHTSGLRSGGIGSKETAPTDLTQDLAGYAATLGAVPLDFQPGSQWAYSPLAGIDTLGRIVEVASGQGFDVFLRERVFKPLGMLDTTFVLGNDRSSRVANIYRHTSSGLESVELPDLLNTKTLFLGGAGLWSTADDYLKFAQMLVNNGELNGTRLLGSRTVDVMASNHVGDLFAQAGRQGRGFGLTVDVVVDSVQERGSRSTGSFGWSGAWGTHFWVDRKEDLTALLMIQARDMDQPLHADFQNAVMQAIVD